MTASSRIVNSQEWPSATRVAHAAVPIPPACFTASSCASASARDKAPSKFVSCGFIRSIICVPNTFILIALLQFPIRSANRRKIMTNVFHEHFESTVKFAPTLRANDYSAENRYQAELNSIFHREWIYAAHQSQFPEKGSYLTFDIADKPLLLVRGQDDEIRAFYNICVHRGHILAEGSGKASHFTCPYHAWTYALDGRLRAARGVSDIDQLPKCHRSLVPVETHTKDGFVFVRLSPGDNSFTERYGSFFTELQEQFAGTGPPSICQEIHRRSQWQLEDHD